MVEKLKTIDTVDTRPFKKLVMTIGELPTSFVESMTYYELLAWFVNYLETVIIPTVNNNAEAVQELQDLFVELRKFVDEYFDNLDVQDEIDNKLDEMAESGELAEIISEFLRFTILNVFDTVDEMKNSDKLVDGSFAKTLGFYRKDDTGGNIYKIRTIEQNETIDEMSKITLSSNLIAELIPEETITPEKMGAKCDLVNDDSNYIYASFEFAKLNKIPLTLTKNYYINSNTTLDAANNHIDIIEKSGYLKIDGSITLSKFNSSNIELNLKDGGDGDVEKNAVIIEEIHTCSLKLTANNVKKTAFFVNHRSGDVSLSRNDFKVYGESNTRTLLHKSVGEGSGYIGGYFFGIYTTICDRVPEYPILFSDCNDVTILHYENYFADETLTKNSLEIINCGSIHIGKLLVGDMSLNAVLIQSSNVTIDEALIINGKDYAHPERQGVGIKIKNDCSFNCNILRSVHCSIAVDATEMLYGRKIVINRVIIDNDEAGCKGIALVSSSTTGIYPLAYNSINNPVISAGCTSDYGNVQNVKVKKQNNLVFISGYMIINTAIPAGENILTITPSSKFLALERTDMVCCQGTRCVNPRIKADTTNLVCDKEINPSNGNILTFNAVYPAKNFDSY